MRLLFTIGLMLFFGDTSLAIQSPGDMYPFAGPVGSGDTTAMHKDSAAFSGWADGYVDYLPGSHVDEMWRDPAEGLGKASGIPEDIVCLGRGGRITLTFSLPISDGEGFDFAVFENGFSDVFLELGWVEVSSDGEHFCRFPNYYGGNDPVSAFGGHEASLIYGLASKYRRGYGHPFDLSELQEAYDACFPEKPWFFTSTYADALTANFPYLDLNQITHVRIIDVVGDGSAEETSGRVIYDPYPTTGSAGFDLDAIGVIHQASVSGNPQTIAFDPIPHQKLAFGSVVLEASADSGLPVSFGVQSGPATVAGSLLTFTGTGAVEVVASQPGDTTYAPASPILRSFMVAENLQHIFVEAVPNQIQGSGSVQVRAYASSGLPVKMQVSDGPASVLIDEDTHVLSLGAEAGFVELRAFQSGNSSVAPAEDVRIAFDIVASGATNAPMPFPVWLASNAVPNPSIFPVSDIYGHPTVRLDYTFDLQSLMRCRIMESEDLVEWTRAVPEILEQNRIGNVLQMKVQLPADSSNRCFRLQFEEQ
jgi:hypothetical protein